MVFCIFKTQQNTPIKVQHIRSQNTLHITCQLIHVSTPRCHHQAVRQQQHFVGPTSTSGAIRPHYHHKSLQCWNCRLQFNSTCTHCSNSSLHCHTGWSKSLCAPDNYNPHTIDDLKMAITEHIRNVYRAILNMVFENTVWRVNKYLETGEGYCERYL
jgi:hypothetical protein